MSETNQNEQQTQVDEQLAETVETVVVEESAPKRKRATKAKTADGDKPARKAATQKAKPVKKEPVKEPEEPRIVGRAWYIIKVQVNREDKVRDDILNRAAIAGLDKYFGETLVPTEKVTEIRGDKKKIVKRKLYPGYLMMNMEVTDETWFLVRETPGVGDFTGAGGKPVSMLQEEVDRILASERTDTTDAPKIKVGYNIGDQVKIKTGAFESQEGLVEAIDYTSGRVTVSINMFGRSTPTEFEYWQLESPN
jgi:transcriptional antiterminator NusG